MTSTKDYCIRISTPEEAFEKDAGLKRFYQLGTDEVPEGPGKEYFRALKKCPLQVSLSTDQDFTIPVNFTSTIPEITETVTCLTITSSPRPLETNTKAPEEEEQRFKPKKSLPAEFIAGTHVKEGEEQGIEMTPLPAKELKAPSIIAAGPLSTITTMATAVQKRNDVEMTPLPKKGNDHHTSQARNDNNEVRKRATKRPPPQVRALTSNAVVALSSPSTTSPTPIHALLKMSSKENLLPYPTLSSIISHISYNNSCCCHPTPTPTRSLSLSLGPRWASDTPTSSTSDTGASYTPTASLCPSKGRCGLVESGLERRASGKENEPPSPRATKDGGGDEDR
ncbi:MAG: hypothetical protein Q9227_002763 [Pyrenula ochraceoflavens]